MIGGKLGKHNWNIWFLGLEKYITVKEKSFPIGEDWRRKSKTKLKLKSVVNSK